MRPFPKPSNQLLPAEQRIYNYRLSRARMMVECAFGILAGQWRVYSRVLSQSPEVRNPHLNKPLWSLTVDLESVNWTILYPFLCKILTSQSFKQVAEDVVKATLVLHNFLRWDCPDEHPNSTATSEPSIAIEDLSQADTIIEATEALDVRDSFVNYFSSPAGEVHWQHDVINPRLQ